MVTLAGLLQFEILFFLYQNSIDAFLLSFLCLCNRIANVDLLLIPQAFGSLHELDALVGCILLKSKWSEFSCRGFLLLRKGLVR
jgi:hypothetical protein